MKLLYSILLVVLPSLVFAQSNYHAGYVVKTGGDTLRGYINYQEWTKSPRSIHFKINKEDKQTLAFNPLTIRGFQINGMETYTSFLGLISTNRTAFSDVPEKLDTGKKMDTVFLRQEVTGRHLTLFYHSDEIKTRFFIAEGNAAPTELKFYDYYNENKQIINSDIYKGQLLLYANKYDPGNDKLVSRINQAHYDQSNLEQLVDKLNNNGNDVKEKFAGRLFVGLALNRTITEVHDVNYSGLTQDYTTIAPKVNFGIDFFDNPNVQRFIFRAALSFSYVTPHYDFPVTVSEQNLNEVYSFDQYTASIIPQLLCNIYNKDDFKIYADIGAAFNFSAYTNNKLTVPNSSPFVPYKLESFYSNFPLQAGVILNKKVELFVTRTGYAAYTKYTSFHASNQSYSLGVNFLFGKN